MFNKYKKEIAGLKADLESQKAANIRRIDHIGKLDADLLKARAGRDKLRKQVREQTVADILLNALRATGIAQDEQREPRYYLERDASLQARLQQQGNRCPGGLMGMGGLLGALRP